MQRTVTGIEELSKTRSRIFLDGEFAFVLYRGELRKYQIRQGSVLEEETVQELKKQVLPRRAKLRAMNLLLHKQYTEKQLRDKLLLGGYTEEVAEEAIAYVKSYHYVDDARYALDYIGCHLEKHSRRELEQKLMQRGISKDIIAEAIQQFSENGLFSDEEKTIKKILEKKHFANETADEKEKRRIFGYFYRRGFSIELVKRVMEECEKGS